MIVRAACPRSGTSRCRVWRHRDRGGLPPRLAAAAPRPALQAPSTREPGANTFRGLAIRQTWRKPSFRGKLMGDAWESRAVFVRLGKSARTVAGRFIALIYLFCVLAPGVALALGTGPAPCFDDEFPAMRAIVTHQQVQGMPHDHSGMHLDHHADAASVPAKHTHDGKSSPGPCCAMLCVTALPANLPSIVKPSLPTSICVPDAYRTIWGRAPPVLYRPPIV